MLYQAIGVHQAIGAAMSIHSHTEHDMNIVIMQPDNSPLTAD